MQLKIEDNFFTYSNRVSRIPSIDLKLDLNKHYPVFKLFDFNNIFTKELVTKHNYYNTSINNIISNEFDYCHKDYTKDHINIFLNKNRNIGINYWNRSKTLKSLVLNTDNLQYPLLRMSNNYYSTYTLGDINTGFIYLLCVKQEYIYYIKLCALAKIQPEFDCFYILAVNGGKERCTNTYSKRIYNVIIRAIKDYRIPVTYVDSIEAEIAKELVLPKFNTIKDYNNWLNNIKEGFLNSCKKTNLQENKTFIDLLTEI